jgi:hypothetical protein
MNKTTTENVYLIKLYIYILAKGNSNKTEERMRERKRERKKKEIRFLLCGLNILETYKHLITNRIKYICI